MHAYNIRRYFLGFSLIFIRVSTNFVIIKSQLLIIQFSIPNVSITAAQVQAIGYTCFNIPLLIGDPTKIMSIGWKPLISIEDSLTDLFNEMVIRRRLELKMQAEQKKSVP